jgi:DNA-binding MltR family transcriptional regulator
MENKKNEDLDLRFLNLFLSGENVADEFKEATKKYVDFRSDLIKESDRGVALLATAYLDSQLEIMLKAKLIGSNKSSKELFTFNGPLGTFSGKIRLSYAIGLMSKDCMHDINIARKIRNDFAHSRKIISFEDGNMTDSCKKMKLNLMGRDANPRMIFIHVSAAISGLIDVAMYRMDPFTSFDDKDFSILKKAHTT